MFICKFNFVIGLFCGDRWRVCVCVCVCVHACYVPPSQEAMNRELYSEAYSTSSLRGMEHAASFNFISYRALVMTVNIPVQERNVTCRMSLTRYYTIPSKTVHFASQDGGIATVARMQSHNCTYKYILF